MTAYRHLVESDGPDVTRARLYEGTSAADAMAAWSRAVSEGNAYVTIESLVMLRPDLRVLDELTGREKGSEVRFDGQVLRTRCGHSFATCHTDRCFRKSRASAAGDILAAENARKGRG